MFRTVWMAALLAACTSGGGGSDTVDGTDGTGPDPSETWETPPCDDSTSVLIVPDYEMSFEEILGWPTMHYIPEDPRGLIFAFHGRGGSAAQQNTLHYQRLWTLMIEAGFGVVAVDSQDRATTYWDTNPEAGANEDMAHHRALRQELIELGKITEDTPLWAWGFSNGATFAPVFGDMALQLDWPIRGVTSHNSGGRTVDLPTFITSSEHDDLTPGARQTHEAQVEAGYPSKWVETKEYPFTRELMRINASYDERKAELVFDDLVGFGYIDENGERIADVSNVDGLMAAYENQSTLPGPSQVTVVLRVAWATHRPTSETACEERDFMIEHL